MEQVVADQTYDYEVTSKTLDVVNYHEKLDGIYLMVFMTENRLAVMPDPYGFRLLVMEMSNNVREIKKVVDIQEKLLTDFMKHKEPDRNDMVEYLSEQLPALAFTGVIRVQFYGIHYAKLLASTGGDERREDIYIVVVTIR